MVRLSRKDRKQAEKEVVQAMYRESMVDKFRSAVQQLKEGMATEQDPVRLKVAELREEMGWKAAIRGSILYMMLGLIMFLGEISLVGTAYALSTLFIFIPVLYWYSTRLYHPSYTHVLEMKIAENGPMEMNWYHFPRKIFRKITKVHPVNPIDTDMYGDAYLASSVEFEGDIPARITFAWMHYPENEFVMKSRIYAIMKEHLNRVLIVNNELKELMNLQVWAEAKEITSNTIRTIGIGKQSRLSELIQEEQRLSQKIMEDFRNMDDLEKSAYRTEEARIDVPQSAQ